MQYCSNANNSVKVCKNSEYVLDPRLVKAMLLLKIVLLIYPVFGLFVSLFDLGTYEISKRYCTFMKSIVPSIQGTAMVSSDVNGTCLVISIAWSLAIYLACQWLYWAVPSQIIESHFKQNPLKCAVVSFFGLCFFGCTLIWFFNYPLTLEGYGRSSRIIRWSLNNGAFTSASVAGMMIIVQSWGIAVSVFLGIKTIIIYFRRK